jgi:hypothetical protein
VQIQSVQFRLTSIQQEAISISSKQAARVVQLVPDDDVVYDTSNEESYDVSNDVVYDS